MRKSDRHGFTVVFTAWRHADGAGACLESGMDPATTYNTSTFLSHLSHSKHTFLFKCTEVNANVKHSFYIYIYVGPDTVLYVIHWSSLQLLYRILCFHSVFSFFFHINVKLFKNPPFNFYSRVSKFYIYIYINNTSFFLSLYYLLCITFSMYIYCICICTSISSAVRTHSTPYRHCFVAKLCCEHKIRTFFAVEK
jgi:hypothetical protein